MEFAKSTMPSNISGETFKTFTDSLFFLQEDSIPTLYEGGQILARKKPKWTCQPLQSRISMILMILCTCDLFSKYQNLVPRSIGAISIFEEGLWSDVRTDQPRSGIPFTHGSEALKSPSGEKKKSEVRRETRSQPLDITMQHATNMWLGAMVTQKVHTKWWP